MSISKSTLNYAATHGVKATFLASAMAGIVDSEKSEAKADSAAYNATIVVSLLTCEKIGRAMGQGDYNEDSGKKIASNVWTMFLKRLAFNGFPVFAGQDMSPIKAIRSDKERATAVNAMFKDMKGAPKAKAIRKVQSLVRKIVLDSTVNHADTLRELYAFNSEEAQIDAWKGHIKDSYGDSYGAALEYFKAPKGESSDWYAKAAERVAKADLSALESLNALAAAIRDRIATLASVAAAGDGVAAEMEDSDIILDSAELDSELEGVQKAA